MIRRLRNLVLMVIFGVLAWIWWQERPPKPVLKTVPEDEGEKSAQERLTGSRVTETSTEVKKDPLTEINGIGPAFEAALNEVGITSFRQLSEQTPEELADQLGARVTAERIMRDGWIEQARERLNHMDMPDEE